MKRAIQHHLETLLAQAVLRGEFGEEDVAVVDVAATGPPRLVLSKGARVAPALPAVA